MAVTGGWGRGVYGVVGRRRTAGHAAVIEAHGWLGRAVARVGWGESCKAGLVVHLCLVRTVRATRRGSLWGTLAGTRSERIGLGFGVGLVLAGADDHERAEADQPDDSESTDDASYDSPDGSTGTVICCGGRTRCAGSFRRPGRF